MPTPILFVHHRSELGGAPTSLSYLIAHLDRDRFEPHVYCPEGAAADLFRSAGAIVHPGPVAAFTHIWASTYRGRRWLLLGREAARLGPHAIRFNALLRRESFAAVHLNDSPLLPAAVIARRRGVPVIWHLRSALADRTSLRGRLIRRAIRRLATMSIAINQDVAESFDVGAQVIPNGVDLDRFPPGDSDAAKRALGLPTSRPAIAFFGFIYPSKGFREFLSAAALLRARGVEATYLVVGGAVRGEEFFSTLRGRILQGANFVRNYEREARLLVATLGIEDVVRFVPFTPDPAQIYRASDIVVAPSRGPELGRPVIEAAACGVPAVASGSTDGGGIIIPDETGVLVDGTEPTLLAETISRLLDDSEYRQRLGTAARAYAEEQFDAAKNAHRVEDVYLRAIPALDRRIPVLYVHHRPQLGGAPVSLGQLIENIGDGYRAPRPRSAGTGRRPVLERRGGGAHRSRRDLPAYVGQPVLGDPLAHPPARAVRTSAAREAVPKADAHARIPDRPHQRLAHAPRSGDGAQARSQGGLAPPLGACT